MPAAHSAAAGVSCYLHAEGYPLAIIEKKPEKKKIDEAAVDRIVEETKQRKNLKEQIYDKITLPVWALDVLIVLLVAALALVIIFGRG